MVSKDNADIVREGLVSLFHAGQNCGCDKCAVVRERIAALDALVVERDEARQLSLRLNEQLNAEWKKRVAAEKERDEYKQAADAEAFAADEFRARLIAAKTVMPDWTPEGWDAFIDAALAPKEDNA